MKPDLRKSVPPQQLFIERSIQFLKPGGKAAIVTPDSILTNPSEKFIRHWLLKNAKILAAVKIPYVRTRYTDKNSPDTRRKTRQSSELFIKSNHKTFTAEATNVGSDSNNDPVFLRTPEGEK